MSAARPAAAPSWLAPLAVVLLSLLLYGNSASNGFALDDDSILVDNPAIRSLARVPELFAADYWEPTVKSGLYRPLVTLSYALNHAVGGFDPLGYHWVNIALHALVAWLVLRLFRRVTGDEWVAAGGALYFAAHAVHTEAVANVVGRAELMAAAFFLLALLGHAASEEAAGGRARLLHAAALLAYGMALLCKENAITFLGAAVLYDLCQAPDPERRFWPRLRAVVRRRLGPRYLGFLAVTALYLAARFAVLTETNPTNRLDNPLVALDPLWRIPNALLVACHYLRLLVFPQRLSYDYSYDQIPLLSSLFDPRMLLVVALCGFGVWILAWSYRSFRGLFFATGFWLVTFSIVSNLLVTTGTILGERLMYLPSVGFCLAVALIARRACQELHSRVLGRAAFVGLFVLIVASNGWRTVLRNSDWESDERLLVSALEVSPRSAKVHHNAGAVYLGLGREEDALEEFHKALEILPEYAKAHASLGHLLLAQGREREAIESYERALAHGTADSRVYNNLGYLMVERGVDLERGVRLLERAFEWDPDDPHVQDSLGWAYFKLGRTQEAYDLIRRSLESDASSTSAEERRAHLREVKSALERKGPEPLPR